MRDYAETGDDSDVKNARKSALEWCGLLGWIALDARWVATYVYHRLRRGESPATRRVRLRNFMEMEPSAANRVTLSAEVDPHGEPKARVHHECTELDRRSLVAVHQTLDAELDRLGLGRVIDPITDQQPWPIDSDAAHHIGTTRMGDDPTSSVVDRDCRIHTSSNVYVAGSSVFPASGAANPTYTIVALSIRLGEHLRQRLRPGSQYRPIGQLRVSERRPAEPDDALAVPAAPRRVLVVGAGRRIVRDVLPALSHLGDRYEIAGLAARSPRVIEVDGHEHHVEAVTDLTPADMSKIDLVVVCVSKRAVPVVLDHLGALGGEGLDLVIDTPILRPSDLGHLPTLGRFRNVWVAEDCSMLPWIETIRAAVSHGEIAAPSELHSDRAAYRYHGTAVIRSVLGGDLVRARRRRVSGGVRTDLWLAGGRRASMIEPHDPPNGSLTITAGSTVITDSAGPAAVGHLALRPIVDGERCTGFRLGEVETSLTPDESDVLGSFAPSDTLTSRMDDLKRVGLMRMLAGIEQGRGGYELADGLEDVMVETSLTVSGWWIAAPLTRLRSDANRRVVGQMARLASRVRR
jgi:hypothetical protein